VTDELARFRLDYTPLLLRYLAQRDEVGLRAAYELGRDAMRDSVSLLDVVRVHNELFIEVLEGVRDLEEGREVARASTALLIDLLASFEMSQRGFMVGRLGDRPGHESAPGTSG
jgi:hypothetical protein